MSLQHKFAALVALIALTVVISVGTAAWAVRMFDVQYSGSLAGAAASLGELATASEPIIAQVELMRAIEPRHSVQPAESASLSRLSASAIEHARQLETDAVCRSRLGFTSCDSLAIRIRQSQDHVARYLAAAPSTSAEAVRHDLSSVAALIESMRRHVVTATEDSAGQAGHLRGRLNLIFGLALAASAFLCVLSMQLMRRWVLAPIAELRRAAERLAAGDFSARLDIKGRDELALLAADVNHMSRTIVDMQEERIERERLAVIGRMARRLAHNLRNPLAGIRSLAEFTGAELPAGSPLAENQDRIVSAVDKFEQWLAELLDVTSPMQPEFERRSVISSLQDIVEAMRPMARARDVRLEVDLQSAPAEAIFDDRHLRHAVVALLSNALEAAPRGGVARISAYTPSDPPDHWGIRIEDAGAGIPAEIAEKVFDVNFTTKKEGNGIGLAVAQQVARLHGGSLDLAGPEHPARQRTDSLAGAVFLLSLPLDPPATADRPAA